MGQSCCAQPLEEDVALELSAVDHRTVLTGTEQSYASSTLLDASRRSGGLDHVPGRCKEVPTLVADPQCHLAIATAAQDPKDSGRTASAKLKTRLLQEAEQLIDEGLDEWLRSWCTDEVLCTFLGASSKESAVASLATALKWRRRYKDILTGSRAPCWQGDMRVVARGAAGHPVIFMSMQHQPPKSSSVDTSEHMAAVLEAAVSAAHAGAWGFDVAPRFDMWLSSVVEVRIVEVRHCGKASISKAAAEANPGLFYLVCWLSQASTSHARAIVQRHNVLIAEQNMLAETTTVDDLSDSRSLRQNLGDEVQWENDISTRVTTADFVAVLQGAEQQSASDVAPFCWVFSAELSAELLRSALTQQLSFLSRQLSDLAGRPTASVAPATLEDALSSLEAAVEPLRKLRVQHKITERRCHEAEGQLQTLRVELHRNREDGHNGQDQRTLEALLPGSGEDASEFHCWICQSRLGKRFFNPRHHCRACEKPVCGQCSPSSIIMDGRTTLQRVCTHCAQSVQEACRPKLTLRLQLLAAGLFEMAGRRSSSMNSGQLRNGTGTLEGVIRECEVGFALVKEAGTGT
ncbi:unnamed protein product [Symbiodinium natans]|uniref:FYVE-type domain-containing protein n=1 Tax=Symbiodinium natans TaxID=878477 RepID=A0A812R1A1_9DINO|nr:unnamed protein product [Symbiodinium natans]